MLGAAMTAATDMARTARMDLSCIFLVGGEAD